MANEFERINNPDSTPGAVSTGYQLQNTGFIAQRVGLDCSVVLGGTGQCTLEVSGPVDVNGEIYTCNAQVVFPLVTAGKYYIHLAGAGANLTPTIGTGANTFDADKNARYTDTGTYRVLNWVIYYNGTTAYVHRLVNPVNADNDYGDVSTPEEAFLTTNLSTWTAKRSKYYNISIGNSFGAVRAFKRIFINAGNIWTVTLLTSTPTYNASITNGVTTITNNYTSTGSIYSITGQDYVDKSSFSNSGGQTIAAVLIQG